MKKMKTGLCLKVIALLGFAASCSKPDGGPLMYGAPPEDYRLMYGPAPVQYQALPQGSLPEEVEVQPSETDITEENQITR